MLLFDFPRGAAAALDCFVLFLAFCVAFNAVSSRRRSPAARIWFLATAFLMALSATSCTTAPEPRPWTRSEQNCLDLVEVFCFKEASVCGRGDIDECLSSRFACAGVRGISDAEADGCAAASARTSCDVLVPNECVGIAEPPPEEPARVLSPQPEARDL